eukprot:TRINITY_DN11778_c0_g1_i1.p1 TRINITY_DN11778_c0_g1~~TRINITY_DN11778_c0_g1_i1.p1  ORF type:complete len:486 (+),score=102.86 TRINITY_DN11778_c0_g1_i1:413-1870(+)
MAEGTEAASNGKEDSQISDSANSRTELVELPKVSDEEPLENELSASKDIDPEAANTSTFSPDKLFDEYSKKYRFFLLFMISSCTFLLPVSDSSYLPALPEIGVDLNTTPTLASFTFSIFTIFMGISPLFWGPVADYLGRKATLCTSLCIYLGSTIGLVFPKTIWLFLLLRVVQAIGCSSFIVVGISIIADIFPPNQRGRALGYFGVPVLFGPVLGPVIGGALAYQWGWRAIFMFLSVLGGIFLVLQLFLLRETMPYIAFNQRFAKKLQIENPFPKPRLVGPWKSAAYLKYPVITNLAVLTGFAFGTLFNLLANLLPIEYVGTHGLTTLQSGLCFLPFGVSCIIGSILGGQFSDRIIKRTKLLESQLIGSLIGFSLVLIGAMIDGWLANYHKGGLAALIVFSCVVGFGNAFGINAAFGYPPSIKPKSAGKIVGITQSTTWIIAGLMVIIGEQISQKTNGYGWMMVFFLRFDVLRACSGCDIGRKEV